MMSKEFKISDDEVFEPIQKKKINKKLIIAITFILVIAILVISILPNLSNVSKLIIKSDEYELNTVSGNVIMNNGVSAIDNEYIYYIGSNEDVSATNIYRAKIGTSEYETFYEGGYDIRYVNVLDDYVCFMTFGYRILENGEYDYDVKIHKVNKNDKTDEILIDNDVSYNYVEMFVFDNYLYYSSKTDENVYRINLIDNSSELFMETKNGFISIDDGYILYSYADNNAVYIREIDTNNEIKLSDTKLLTPQVYKNYVYYINDQQKLARVSIENGTSEIVYNDSEMYDIILANGYVFYINYADYANGDYSVILFKYNLENGQITRIKELEQLGYLNIVGNYVYNMHVDSDNNVTALLTNYDDSTEITLQTWDYTVDDVTYNDEDIEELIGTDA